MALVHRASLVTNSLLGLDANRLFSHKLSSSLLGNFRFCPDTDCVTFPLSPGSGSGWKLISRRGQVEEEVSLTLNQILYDHDSMIINPPGPET